MNDFTIEMYLEIIKAIANSQYRVITFAEFFKNNPTDKIIIIRHDVDKWPTNALKLAKIEKAFSLKATYYFRNVKKVFNPVIIKSIEKMEHEVGYHYETMSQAKGDLNLAYKLFIDNLTKFRKLVAVNTICMHGSSFSKYDNRWLWNTYNYKELNIIGEPYLDINYKKMIYFSDSGGSWKNSGQRTRDNIKECEDVNIETSPELIEIINNGEVNQLILLMHPDRWNEKGIIWYYEYISKIIRNFIKKVYNVFNSRLRN